MLCIFVSNHPAFMTIARLLGIISNVCEAVPPLVESVLVVVYNEAYVILHYKTTCIVSASVGTLL